jgi:DNA-binding CsgD family transcriptional regulator/tetratricopeptide (TPR) repeat protein
MAIVTPDVSPSLDFDATLMERDEARSALARYLSEATAGNGRFVVLRGEAGIGKTALLRDFLGTLPTTVSVLAGAADGVSTPAPYGPIEDMVDAAGPELATLLHADSRRVEVGRWLLRRLSSGSPHVVAVEDVHWADQATLEVLAFLARRIEGLPILVVVTYRDGAVRSPSVIGILGTIATMPTVRQIALEPLSSGAVAGMVVGVAAGQGIDAAELHRITSGNPFYVREVLRQRGRGAGGADRIPISILDAVRARVGQLDERGRRAIEAVAILGIRAEPWLLASIAGEDLLGIDDGLRIGLLVSEGGVAFRHELTRMAVLEDMPVVRGIALHRRALAALERAGTADSARLAYHAEGAADAVAAVRHASAAGRRAAAVGALNEAANQFGRALRFLPGGDVDLRVELLEWRAEALHLTNQNEISRSTWREAIELRRALGDPRSTGVALASAAMAYWHSGRTDEAAAAAREAVALLEPIGDTRDLAIALACVGRVAMLAGRYDEATAACDRALEIGRRIPDLESVADATITNGVIAADRGDEGAVASLETALAMAREAGLAPIVDRALNNLGVIAADDRRLADADRWFAEMENHFERSEIERCSGATARAEIALMRGDWAEAERRTRAALSVERVGPADCASGHVALGRLGLRRGEAGWQDFAVVAEAISIRFDSAQFRLPIALLDGEHAWIAGDPSLAAPRLHAAYAEARANGDRWSIGETAILLWRNGLIEGIDERAPAVYQLEVEGRIAEAAAQWERYGMPYDAAVCLAGSEDPSDVARAHAILVGLGADAVARKVAQRLRRLGAAVPRGPRTKTRANVAGLTEREAEIAGMLADGLSNAEIADRLVVSRRTVGHHVSAVLAKLGVRSRAAVASALGRATAAL